MSSSKANGSGERRKRKQVRDGGECVDDELEGSGNGGGRVKSEEVIFYAGRRLLRSASGKKQNGNSPLIVENNGYGDEGVGVAKKKKGLVKQMKTPKKGNKIGKAERNGALFEEEVEGYSASEEGVNQVSAVDSSDGGEADAENDLHVNGSDPIVCDRQSAGSVKVKEVPESNGNRRMTRSSSTKKQVDASSGKMSHEDNETEEKHVLTPSVGKKRKHIDVTPKKGTVSGLSRKRGRDGANEKKLLSDYKMSPASGKGSQTKYSGETKPKNLKDSGAHAAGLSVRSASQCSSLSRGRKSVDKTSSVVSKGTVLLKTEETTSVQKKISRGKKRGRKPRLDSSNDKRLTVSKGQTSSTSESAHATRIAKQNVRDKIKDILLSLGWTIDNRPRNGRLYLDSVYVSPKGNTYWSITKAYGVLERQMNQADDTTDPNSPGKPSKKSKGNRQKSKKAPMFTPIPEEELGILRKVISKRRSDWNQKKINKIRSKKELEEAKRKFKDGKVALPVVRPASKYLKSKGREFKKTKRNKIVGSTAKAILLVKTQRTKDIVGSKPKKPVLKKGVQKRRGNALLVRGSNKGSDIYVPYIFKRTILSWLIDLGIMPASGKVKYMRPNSTEAVLEGWITRNGIHCDCCCKILTVSMFETHAGSELRQPYQNLYLEKAGVSLLQCQQNALDKHKGSVCQSFFSVETDGDDPNDDTCSICGDGGDLICCDRCPSTYHQSCLGIQKLPSGDWHCMNCSCKFCGVVFSLDGQDNGVSDTSLLSCAQCEEKYHHECVPKEDVVPVCSSLSCISFCGHSCKEIFERLQNLVGAKNDLDSGFSWTLLRCLDDDICESVLQLDQRVECNSKIAVAHAVMDECFLPIIDQRSGINLISNVVYNCGSNFNRLNFHGFYTFILERNDEIICVATLRFHGTKFAEMPFIGTRDMYRRQGMCRRLLNEIESVLSSLSIAKLIIPAISDLVKTWTKVFGFKAAEVSLKEELRSVNVLVFPGTGLLFKPVQINDSSQHHFGDKLEADNDNYPFDAINNSSGCELDVYDDATAQCEHEIKGTIPDSSDMLPDSCDSPSRSEPMVLEYNSSEIANDEVIAQTEHAGKLIVPDSSDMLVESCESPNGSKILVLKYKSSETATEEGILQYENDIKGIASDSLQFSPKSSDSPHGSEPRILEYNASGAATDQSLLLYPKEAYCVETAVDDSLQVSSPFGPGIKLLGEADAQNKDEAKLTSTCDVQDFIVANHIVTHQTSDSKCRTSDDSTSTLHGSGVDAATNLQPVDVTFLPGDNGTISTSPNAIASTSAESGRNDHLSVSSNGCHGKGSDISAGHMVVDHNIKHQVGTSQFSHKSSYCPRGSEPRVETTVDNSLQVSSPFGPGIKLLGETDAQSNDEGIVTSTCHVQDLIVVNHILAQQTSESKCRTSDDSTSTLRDFGVDAATSLQPVGVTLLPGDNGTISTSPNTIASTSAEFGANDHLLVSSNACHGKGSDISTGPMVDDHNIKYQVGTVERNFSVQLEPSGSCISSGQLDTIPDSFLSTTEPKNHADGEGIAPVVHESEAKFAYLGPKLCFDDGETNQSASEVSKTSVYVGLGKECYNSCVSSASSGDELKL